MTEPSRLAALIDGAPLDPDASRALWTEFSAHMDEHRGDFAGFARAKGWHSVTPEYQQGKAVLVVRTTAAPAPAAPKPAATKAAAPKAGAKPKPRKRRR
jgi:hypothetical protein